MRHRNVSKKKSMKQIICRRQKCVCIAVKMLAQHDGSRPASELLITPLNTPADEILITLYTWMQLRRMWANVLAPSMLIIINIRSVYANQQSGKPDAANKVPDLSNEPICWDQICSSVYFSCKITGLNWEMGVCSRFERRRFMIECIASVYYIWRAHFIRKK